MNSDTACLVYHGSVTTGFDGTLLPRAQGGEGSGREGINYAGTWFTSEPLMAVYFGTNPREVRNVHMYRLPEGRYYTIPEGKGLAAWHTEFAHLIGDTLTSQEIATMGLYPPELHRAELAAFVAKQQNGTVTDFDQLRVKAFCRSRDIAAYLNRHSGFVGRVVEHLKSQGYAGIHWPRTDDDTRYAGVERHDVWLVFNDTPIMPIAKVPFENKPPRKAA